MFQKHEFGSVVVVGVVVGPLQVNCWVVQDLSTQQGIIVDPGGDFDLIESVCQQLGITELGITEITKIVNTHGHGDHIGANREAKTRYQNAALVIHQSEAAYLTDPELNLSSAFGLPLVSPAADETVQDGDELLCGSTSLRVEHLPGHSPGCIALVGDGFALVGDVVFRQGIGRTDLPGSDDLTMRATLARIAAEWHPDRILFPGHGPPTKVKWEAPAW